MLLDVQLYFGISISSPPPAASSIVTIDRSSSSPPPTARHHRHRHRVAADVTVRTAHVDRVDTPIESFCI
jgi:hypothetical protein